MSKPTKKPALGRGLSALLPDRPAAPPPPPAPPLGPAAAVEVEVAKLRPNRFQPRTDFDEGALEELTRSIRANGVLQPIVVAPDDGGGFTIVAGERRFRAAQRAGLSKVPVVLHAVDSDRAFLELALVENLQRDDLNPIEMAEAYRRLREEFHLSQDEIAAKVGRDRSSVSNTLRLLRLPPEVQADIRSGVLSFGHAKAILGLEKDADRLDLARKIVATGLSVREAENWVASHASGGDGSLVPKRVKQMELKDVFTREAEETLSGILRTRVEIIRKRRGGEVRLRFSSEDELIRIYDLLAAAPPR